jgi:hypothetical protein
MGESFHGHRVYGRGAFNALACVDQTTFVRRRIVTGMPNPDKFRDSFVTKLSDSVSSSPQIGFRPRLLVYRGVSQSVKFLISP